MCLLLKYTSNNIKKNKMALSLSRNKIHNNAFNEYISKFTNEELEIMGEDVFADYIEKSLTSDTSIKNSYDIVITTIKPSAVIWYKNNVNNQSCNPMSSILSSVKSKKYDIINIIKFLSVQIIACYIIISLFNKYLL